MQWNPPELGTGNGESVGTSVYEYPRWKKGLYCDPSINQFRQHPLDYIEGLEESIRGSLKNLDREIVESIAGITADTTGSTPVPVDRKGVPLSLLKEFKDDPEGKKLVKELTQFKFDKIIKKSEYSIFYNTDFEKYCKKQKIDEIYFAGVFAECCIFFSAVDAAYRHIQPYLITDASGCAKTKIEKERRKRTEYMFKLMLGPLITTKNLIKKLS